MCSSLLTASVLLDRSGLACWSSVLVALVHLSSVNAGSRVPIKKRVLSFRPIPKELVLKPQRVSGVLIGKGHFPPGSALYQVESQVSGLKSKRGDRAILGAAPK
jgi:hypothetical protein